LLNDFVDYVFSTFVGDECTSPMFPYTFVGVYTNGYWYWTISRETIMLWKVGITVSLKLQERGIL